MANRLKTLLARPLRDGRSIRDAVERYRQVHADGFGPPGRGTCPVCKHRGCFGRMGLVAGSARGQLWYCFSASHGAVQGADGKPVGRQGSKGYFGDVLDLHAFQAGRTRIQHLRDTGYLARMTSRNKSA